MEGAIRIELDTIPEHERVERLIRGLTYRTAERAFAIVYAVIFGSQIRLMRELNSGPMSALEVDLFFQNQKKQDPLFEHWSTDRSLSYLVHFTMIEQQDDHYYIKESGRNFLRFLTNLGLCENRVG